MNVTALSGRRIDAERSPVARFPLDHAPSVSDALRTLFEETHSDALVCSAACGADLLALEIADALGLHTQVVLPFTTNRFRATSVTDRPGDWGPLFDRLVAVAEQRGSLTIIEHMGTDHDAYLRVTELILQEAIALSHRNRAGERSATPGVVTAVIVWEGASRGPDDLTAHFAATAQALGIPQRFVST